MTPKEFLIQSLAESIADDIMTAGDVHKAHRIKLVTLDGTDLGGWSKLGLTNRIAKHLRGELSSDKWVQFWNEEMEDDEVGSE